MRRVMQQTVMQNKYISSKSTHKLIKKNIWQMIACSMINKIIYNWENQSCQIKWYTMVSLYMWGNQNKHDKIRMTMLSKAKWSINIISMSMYSTNMAMKHRKIKILNQDNQSHNQHVKYLIQIYQWSIRKLAILESPTKIINQHDQHVNVPSESSGTLDVQSRDEYPLIDSPNATFASL